MKYYLNLSGNRICGFHIKPVKNHVEYEADEDFKMYLLKHIGKISLIGGNIVEDEHDYISLRKEKKEILHWLSDNDYIVNKVFLGEWLETDQRYLNYKADRITKRNRLDEIQTILDGQ